jgi:hypothetical protein
MVGGGGDNGGASVFSAFVAQPVADDGTGSSGFTLGSSC